MNMNYRAGYIDGKNGNEPSVFWVYKNGPDSAQYMQGYQAGLLARQNKLQADQIRNQREQERQRNKEEEEEAHKRRLQAERDAKIRETNEASQFGFEDGKNLKDRNPYYQKNLDWNTVNQAYNQFYNAGITFIGNEDGLANKDARSNDKYYMEAYIKGLAKFDAKNLNPQRYNNKLYITSYREVLVDYSYNLGLNLKKLKLTDEEYVETYNKGRNEKLEQLGEEDGKNLVDKAYSDEVYIKAYNKSRNEKLKELGQEDGNNFADKTYNDEIYIETYNKAKNEKLKDLGEKDGYFLINNKQYLDEPAYLEGYDLGVKKLGFEDGTGLKEQQCDDSIYIEKYIEGLENIGFEDGLKYSEPKSKNEIYIYKFKSGFMEYLNKFKKENIIDDSDIEIILTNFDKIDWTNKYSPFAILLNKDVKEIYNVIACAKKTKTNVKTVIHKCKLTLFYRYFAVIWGIIGLSAWGVLSDIYHWPNGLCCLLYFIILIPSIVIAACNYYYNYYDIKY